MSKKIIGGVVLVALAVGTAAYGFWAIEQHPWRWAFDVISVRTMPHVWTIGDRLAFLTTTQMGVTVLFLIASAGFFLTVWGFVDRRYSSW